MVNHSDRVMHSIMPLNFYKRTTPNQASQLFSEVSREIAAMEKQLKELQAKRQDVVATQKLILFHSSKNDYFFIVEN